MRVLSSRPGPESSLCACSLLLAAEPLLITVSWPDYGYALRVGSAMGEPQMRFDIAAAAANTVTRASLRSH